ncbi:MULTISPECIES: hypothetical protein [Acinetobacter]|uniref:hypothetical protein n=1 Tax=Acinetobacter TaxID=469 RepID=UPI0018A32980|nr:MULTISPECIES: hypothetical protein [Acinetobacter]MBF7686010.1 hypothetical protein [Acinetobacter baretiae]MBF7696716.1 hypothetical protein [Acinetobacter rathckeae]
MNRDQMAHEYALKLLEHTGSRTVFETTLLAFNLADAMIKEAKLRTETSFPLDEEHK